MAISLALIVVLGLAADILFRKFKLPGLVGMLIVGVLVGPYVSMGILLSGVGLRASWLPFENRHGQRQGFEVRFTWLASSTTSVQGMLLYAFRLHRPR